MSKHKPWFAFFLILCLFHLASCQKKTSAKKMLSFPVEAQKVTVKDAPIYLETIGHVDPMISVQLKSRVEGELIDMYFKEGQEVSKGDLLYSIDPRPYISALDKAKATLAQNEANLRLAKDKMLRYSSLLQEDYISELDFDELQINVQIYEAIVAQNKADVETASINLDYCQIYAPLDGKTGVSQIDKGNLIAPNNNTLTSINQIMPIYVEFSIPENKLPLVKKYHKEHSLKILASPEDIQNNAVQGELVMLDNTVDTQTGMIKLKAIYENKDKNLWPGQFVKVRIVLTVQKDAMLIPFEAIQNTSSGPVVFVIQEDQKVQMKSVTLGQREEDYILIKSGIHPTDTVVTQGQINLSDGSSVFISDQTQGNS